MPQQNNHPASYGCGECSTSFFNASAASLLAKSSGMMILEPLIKTAYMLLSLHVYYSSAVSMYPPSARGVAGQHASSSGEEQLPYHNLDEKEGNLFSTWCFAAFSGEAFWVVSIITEQSLSSTACCQCWLNSVFSESRLEVLTFIGFQMSNCNQIAKAELVGGHRQHRTDSDASFQVLTDINLPRQILTYHPDYQSISKAVYTPTPDTKEHQILLCSSLSLLHFSTFLLKSFTKTLNF